jgi:hypothetical protein
MISAWWLLVSVILTALVTIFIVVVLSVAYSTKDIDDRWGREFEMEKAEEKARRLKQEVEE